MMVLIAGNFLVFSSGGYLDYRNLVREKREVEEQIKKMDHEEKNLREKLKDTKSPEKMIQYFEKEFFIFKDKVKIIKFQENPEEVSPQNENPKKQTDILFWQNIYIIASSIFLGFITFLAYQKRKNNFLENETE